jgi:hypothetical protein
MTKLAVLVSSALVMLGSSSAFAGPAWCGSAKFDFNSSDMRNMSSKDPKVVITSIAKALCSDSAEVEAHKAEIEQARAAWGKKLGMAEADWADAAAYAGDTYHSPKLDISVKGLGALTPVDQYIAISEGFKNESGYEMTDHLYVTDALDAKLTEVGRMAFLRWCLKDDTVMVKDSDVAKWSVCQYDIDKFDLAKFYSQLSSDTAHDGVVKMVIRFQGSEIPEGIKDYNERKAKQIKKDDTNKKVFEVAAKARDEWTKGVGTNAKLLALVEDMDGAAMFRSRKLFDGCEAKTAEALATAVSTVPAKSFAGMHDDREMRKPGFGESAGPMLANTPVVNLAAIAYAECQKDTATGDYIAAFIQDVPGHRGPRSASLGAIMGETFKFDDMDAGKLSYPKFGARPYGRSGGAIMSSGGIVKTVKAEKDMLLVGLEKTFVMQEDCVQEHHSNRLARIRPDGVLEYELICDKFATVKHDTTWTDFKIRTPFQKILKPGVTFSVVFKDNKPGDVIAIWQKGAKTPSLVLGGAVK